MREAEGHAMDRRRGREPAVTICLLGVSLFVACSPADETARPSDSATQETSRGQCEDVTDLLGRIDCYVELAVDTDDPSACGQSTHEGVEYQCYAIVAERRQSAELCDLIPSRSSNHEKLKDICISDVAGAAENPALCAEVRAPGLKDSCYLKISQAIGDSTLCDDIQDPGLRSVCSGDPVSVP